MQNRVIDACLQLHGGYGYMREYLIARAWADARVQRIYGGANEIMKEIIARKLFEGDVVGAGVGSPALHDHQRVVNDLERRAAPEQRDEEVRTSLDFCSASHLPGRAGSPARSCPSRR
jgi:hypothetical protein